MNIFVSQFYIEVDSNYPFSHHFQHRISDEVTQRIVPSAAFIQKYAEDFDLIFNMSAKASLTQPEIRGPTVFKKDKDVEFTIFLTFDTNEPRGPCMYRRVLKQLLEQIVVVLKRLEMDVSQLSQNADEIIEGIVADPKMIDLTL